MAALPLLDFAVLIAPISPDKPGGDPLPYDLRAKLEEKRQEDDPDSVPAEEQESLRKADWSGIVELAKETLSQKSKDLRVAARLTEALVKQYKFAGLRDGLHLLRELVDQCWDHLQPPIEDGDLKPRAVHFDWLDDPDTGAKLPSTLRLLPLVWRREDNQDIYYGRFHWANKSKDASQRVSREDFEKAIKSTPLADCEQVAQEIAESLEELKQLTRSLDTRMEQMGRDAPSLNRLHKAVEECHTLMQQILKRKRPAAAPKSDMPVEDGAGTLAGPSSGSGRPPVSRDQAYQQLQQAAALLQELEPHSPIPYLVQRAVELGALPFPQLIKALIRDVNVLAELNRELGLKEEPPADGQQTQG